MPRLVTVTIGRVLAALGFGRAGFGTSPFGQ